MGYKSAIFRLLGISGLVVAAGLAVILVLRFVGSEVGHVQPDFRQLGGKPAVFARGDDEMGPIFSRSSIDSVLQSPHLIPALEIRATRDRKWVIFDDGDLANATDLHGRVEQHSFEELTLAKWKDPRGGIGLVNLEDLLKNHPLEKVLFVVNSSEVAAAKSLVEILGERDTNDQQMTLIYSPNHRLNRELKKLRPWWYFGADATMTAQWFVFSAIGLESFIPDDFSWTVLSELTPRIEMELKKRGIQVLIPDISLSRPIHTLLHPMGILTNRPNTAASRFPLPEPEISP